MPSGVKSKARALAMGVKIAISGFTRKVINVAPMPVAAPAPAPPAAVLTTPETDDPTVVDIRALRPAVAIGAQTAN